MGTEDWVLKGTKLITNTKKQRLKIQRLDSQKHNIKEKNKVTKIIKYIYEVCFKNRVFFFAKEQQVIKMKIKGVIEDLKIKFFFKLKE